MVFSSPFFLLGFLPVFLLAYFLVDYKYKNAVVVFFSLFFYMWTEPRFSLVVMISALIDWGLGSAIAKTDNEKTKRRFLALAICQNLGILFYFKYVNFFIESIIQLFHVSSYSFLEIALPVGVSFVVFEKITYVVDIYRGTGYPAKRLLSYLVYVLLFPKLLAGPIIKYHDIADQLQKRNINAENVIRGTVRFIMGLGKKVLIADTMGEIADAVFGLPVAQLGPQNAWLGAICYTLQIYFDFSAYSDMAIGLASIIGFRLMENFNMPYIAANFTEFWRRWHISLSTWIRDYLYIPLGGSRKPGLRTYWNLWICFLLSGLWHGANWTFVWWGVYHGIFLALDKLFWLEWQKRLPRVVNILVTFFLVILGWVIFRATSTGQIIPYIQAMFTMNAGPGQFVYITENVKFYLVLGLLCAFVPILPNYEQVINRYKTYSSRPLLEVLAVGLLLVLALGKLSAVAFNPFLYFRF